jgi:aspartate 1-decarboxylase
MKTCMVKSKIHRATVTDANINYQGSITIDKKLMLAAKLRPFEFVHINNLSNAVHWETYVIEGDDGQICLNGPPARLFQPGDLIVILGFSYLNDNEFINFKHFDILVDKNNHITEILTC